VWQVTTYVGFGATAPWTNAWSNGNSYAGLSGGFGTAIIGNHDTPVRLLGRKVDLFGNRLGDSRNLISDNGASAGWDLRPSNVIAYISPSFSGFSGAIAYVTNVNDAISAPALAAVTALSPNGYSMTAAADNSVTAWSGLVAYDNGPLALGLGYEKHNLSKLASGVNDEKVLRLVGGYGFGDAKVVALWQKEDDILGSNNGRKVWGLGAAYKLGATTLKGQYYKADNVDNSDQTGAKMFALGADYALSKRTTAYAAIAKTSNDNNAAFSAYGGGHGDNPGIATGKNGTGYSVGMTHSF
jgi:predicted porin